MDPNNLVLPGEARPFSISPALYDALMNAPLTKQLGPDFEMATHQILTTGDPAKKYRIALELNDMDHIKRSVIKPTNVDLAGSAKPYSETVEAPWLNRNLGYISAGIAGAGLTSLLAYLLYQKYMKDKEPQETQEKEKPEENKPVDEYPLPPFSSGNLT